MTGAQDNQAGEPNLQDERIVWLVHHVAAFNLATSRTGARELIRAALEHLGLPISHMWSTGAKRPDDVPDSHVLEFGSGGFRVFAAIEFDRSALDTETAESVAAYGDCIEALIERFSEPYPEDPDSWTAPELGELATVLANADNRQEVQKDVLDLFVNAYDPLCAVIVRDDPLSIIGSRQRDNFVDPVALRRIASRVCSSLTVNGTRLVESYEEIPGSGRVRVQGLQLSSMGDDLLVLMSFYRGAGKPDISTDLDRIRQFGATVRASRQFQSLVNASHMNHRFLAALSKTTHAAASTHDLHELYEEIREALSTALPGDAMLISMIPPGRDEAVTVYRSEGETSYFSEVPLSPPFQVAMKLARPFIVDEVPKNLKASSYRFGDATRPVRSLAGAPLIANDTVSGLIVTQSYQPAAFRAEHADLLLEIGRSIAVALERTQLLKRLKTRSERELALRDLTRKLTTTFDPADMLQQVVDGMSAVFSDSLVLAASVDSSVMPVDVIHAVSGPDSLKSSLGIRPDGALEPDGIARGMISTCSRQSRVQGSLVQSVLPLYDNDDCIGSLIVANEAELPFSEDDRSIIAILEGIVVSALRNARLYRDRTRDESDLLEVERISRLVASSLDTEDILAEILSLLPHLFNSEGCSVRIVDGTDLVPLAVHGEIVHTFSDRVPIGTSLAGSIVRDKRLIVVDDLHSHPATGRHARSTGVKVRGWLAAPMIDAVGDVFGILSIHSDFPRRWTERDRVLLQTLAESTTVAIQNAWRFQRTRDVLLASVESLANAVDAKDPTALNHSRNVSSYARSIAEAMQLPAQEVENVALAGLLHDIGKIGLPDRILQKPDILDSHEWEQMKTHPVIGEQILGGNAHLTPILGFVRHHHERWDGMGYPDRLMSDSIPLGATIVALADAVDTMSSDRPSRKAVPWTLVCEVIRSEAGKQFAPEVARTFLEIAGSGRVERLTASSDIQRTIPLDTQLFSHSLDARALMIFHGIAREIRTLTDIETFITNVTQIIRSVMEMSNIQIFLVDDSAGEIVYRPTNNDQARGFNEVRRRIGTGVVGWVVQHGEPLLVPDVRLDDRFIFESVAEVRSELAVPLITDGTVIGAINIESSVPSAFSESDVRLLTATAAHLAQSVEVARLHDHFKRAAATDALTGLANHRAFYERLEEEIRHTEFTESVLTVAIMDVDNLKAVNDTYGHIAGDEVLRAIADVMREHCRRSDHVARYGGDEFAFILADTNLDGATRAIGQIVEALSACKIAVEGRVLQLPTGAWGMATYPQDGVRPAELVRVADQRMYTQKRTARSDRTHLSELRSNSMYVDWMTRVK